MIQMQVTGMAPDQEEDFDVQNGSLLDVLGFVAKGHLTWVIWADVDGVLRELPMWAVRLLVPEAVPA